MKKHYIIFLLFISIVNTISAQNDCSDAIVVCGNSGFSGLTATGVGIQEIPDDARCQSNEHNSIWLRLNINTSGTLAFSLIPSSTSIVVDFDYFLFGPNATCTNLGSIIRCSTTNPQAAQLANNHTGMNETESDTHEGPGQFGNGFLQSLNVIAGETYFMVIDRPAGDSDFSIQWTGTATFFDQPSFQIPTGQAIDIAKCDTDSLINGATSFNFTNTTSVITGTQTGVDVTYHLNSNDAITGENKIIDTTDFRNTQNPQTIHARVTNPITGCFDTLDFTLTVENFNVIGSDSITVCDDAADGDDTNGKVRFDLNAVTQQIFPAGTTGLTISYYLNEPDAFPENNPLPQFFTNTTPNQQSLFMKAKDVDGCYEIKEIHFTINPLPQKKLITLVQCDVEDIDGKTTFNLVQASPELTNNDSNFTAEYFANATDEQNNQNSITLYTNQISGSAQVLARITNVTTLCKRVVPLLLSVNVDQGEEATIQECDLEGTENGFAFFNLDDSNLTQSPTATVTYYETLQDASLEQNAIPDRSNYQNGIAYNDIIYARVEEANKCAGVSVVNLKVNKLPNIQPESDGNDYICTNLPENFITIDAGLITGITFDYTYIWRLDGNVFPRTSYSIQVNQAGTYTVEVINKVNACRKIRTIVVHPSNEAIIESLAIVDVTDNNTVTVNLSPQSIGDYKFSIDAPNGPFQDSNFFDHVASGIHTVYVYDIHGCGTAAQQTAVIGMPKFFTPNGDGFNDFWRVNGVDPVFNTNSKMYIFDRNGKLVKEIATKDTEGWDGTLNGNPLPSDDYWYVVNLEDGRTARGHFALKR